MKAWHLTKHLQSSLQIQSSRTRAYSNSCSYLIPRWGLYYIICISIMAILNGRLKDLIFLSKIPTGTWNNFFEIYKQFGHAPSKRFASPPLDCWTLRNKVLWFFKKIQTTSPVTQYYIPEGQHWMMFMNILTFISDRSYCLCLLRATQPDAQRHIKKHTIRQLTNEQSDSSQFTVSRHIEENNWHSLRPFNWTWTLVHTDTQPHRKHINIGRIHVHMCVLQEQM